MYNPLTLRNAFVKVQSSHLMESICQCTILSPYGMHLSTYNPLTLWKAFVNVQSSHLMECICQRTIAYQMTSRLFGWGTLEQQGKRTK